MLKLYILNNFFYLYIKNNFNLIPLNSYIIPKKIITNVNKMYIYFFEKLLLEYLFKNTLTALLNSSYLILIPILQILILNLI